MMLTTYSVYGFLIYDDLRVLVRRMISVIEPRYAVLQHLSGRRGRFAPSTQKQYNAASSSLA